MVAVLKPAAAPGFVVDEVPIPSIASDEVLVQVEAASLCGTDATIWKWVGFAPGRVQPPVTVGHEFAGTVVEIGKGVTNVAVGDYISAESHVTCGVCRSCRTGQAQTCPSTSILGLDRDGVFAEFASIPEKVVWKNDRAKLPPEIATLQEPFGNAVFATTEQDLRGKTVAVIGCGPLGLFSVGIAAASGAAVVVATDVSDTRLALANTMGADATFNASAGTAESTAWIREQTGGDGADVVLEMSGAAPAIDGAFKGARLGGRVVLMGIPSRSVEVDVANDLVFKNLTVVALNGRRIFDTWYKTKWLLESGAVDLRPLISHELVIEDIDRAMELQASGEACKIVLRPPASAASSESPRGEPNAAIAG